MLSFCFLLSTCNIGLLLERGVGQGFCVGSAVRYELHVCSIVASNYSAHATLALSQNGKPSTSFMLAVEHRTQRFAAAFYLSARTLCAIRTILKSIDHNPMDIDFARAFMDTHYNDVMHSVDQYVSS